MQAPPPTRMILDERDSRSPLCCLFRTSGRDRSAKDGEASVGRGSAARRIRENCWSGLTNPRRLPELVLVARLGSLGSLGPRSSAHLILLGRPERRPSLERR